MYKNSIVYESDTIANQPPLYVAKAYGNKGELVGVVKTTSVWLIVKLLHTKFITPELFTNIVLINGDHTTIGDARMFTLQEELILAFTRGTFVKQK